MLAPSGEVSALTGEGGGSGDRTRFGVDNKLPVCGVPVALCKSCMAATMARMNILANSIVSDGICEKLACAAAINEDRPVRAVLR